MTHSIGYISTAKPNHHLWNNNGTWFIHYTVSPNGYSGTRVRYSLRTKDIRTARSQRDAILKTREVTNV